MISTYVIVTNTREFNDTIMRENVGMQKEGYILWDYCVCHSQINAS